MNDVKQTAGKIAEKIVNSLEAEGLLVGDEIDKDDAYDVVKEILEEELRV